MPIAGRLETLPPYLFAVLRKKIAAKKAAGADVITLGIGDPDAPAPDAVIDALCRAVRDADDPDRHRYGSDALVPEFHEAAVDFYKRRYNVALADDQLIATMGSKDAIVKLCLGLLNPGDIGIAPVPGYPTYNIGHVFAGATTYPMPLRKENGWLPDFDAIPDAIRRQAKILWLNYPNNPTTALADMDFFRRAVAFGRENNILIAHDSAYSENTYDGYKAPSILEVDGAADVAVEFFSLSKAFNMTGWRVGLVAGHAGAVQTLQRVKDNIDNGTLRAVQFAAVTALRNAEAIFQEVNQVYAVRRDRVCAALAKAGWPVEKPKATIYIWAPVPEKYNGSSTAFAEDLLENAAVVVTPGLGFGQWAEGFYRISLTYPDAVIEEAMGRIVELGSH